MSDHFTKGGVVSRMLDDLDREASAENERSGEALRRIAQYQASQRWQHKLQQMQQAQPRDPYRPLPGDPWDELRKYLG